MHRRLSAMVFEKLKAAIENLQDNSQNPQSEKAVGYLIQQVKKITRFVLQKCCLQDEQMPLEIYRFLSFYEKLEHKPHRRVYIEAFFKTFSFSYEDSIIIGDSQSAAAVTDNTGHGKSHCGGSISGIIIMDSSPGFKEFMTSY